MTMQPTDGRAAAATGGAVAARADGARRQGVESARGGRAWVRARRRRGLDGVPRPEPGPVGNAGAAGAQADADRAAGRRNWDASTQPVRDPSRGARAPSANPASTACSSWSVCEGTAAGSEDESTG